MNIAHGRRERTALKINIFPHFFSLCLSRVWSSLNFITIFFILLMHTLCSDTCGLLYIYKREVQFITIRLSLLISRIAYMHYNMHDVVHIPHSFRFSPKETSLHDLNKTMALHDSLQQTLRMIKKNYFMA